MTALGDIESTTAPAAAAMPRDWEFLGDRVAMVSPLPPAHDGIARYTGQLIEAIRGHRDVTTIASPYGDGDLAPVLRGGARVLRLLPLTRRGQDVVVHWHPHYYLKGKVWDRLLTLVSFRVLAHLRKVIVVVHEPHGRVRSRPGLRGFSDRIEEAARRALWGSPLTVVLHTQLEVRRFAERFPARRRQTRVVEHGAWFTQVVPLDRSAARSLLNIPRDDRVALCIGFISPHKGFDRALEAFACANCPGARLHIVGSPIRDTPAVTKHVAELAARAAAIPNAYFEESYVDDGLFDAWIAAADVLLAPYRSASSSSVLARAALFPTPAIVAAEGGLAEQAASRDVVVHDDDELANALARFLAPDAVTEERPS